MWVLVFIKITVIILFVYIVYTVKYFILFQFFYSNRNVNTTKPYFVVFIAVAPQRPRIEYNATHVLPGHNISVKTGERATVKCVSHYGNPPSRLKWFLGKCSVHTSFVYIDLSDDVICEILNQLR